MAQAETELTIDQLVLRTGATSRTIREYQTLGLLDAPRKIGRIGYYDDAHVNRLGVIARLQDRGYSLAGIRDLISAWGAGVGLPAVLGLDNAAASAAADEKPEIVEADRLDEMLPGVTKRSVLATAKQSGLVQRLEDGRFLIPSPALLQLVSDATTLGVPLPRALTVVAAMRDAAATAAAQVVDVFVSDVWTPHVERGMPADDNRQIESFLLRGRGMLQRGAASMIVRELEHAYAKSDAPEAPALRKIVSTVRVGAVTESTSPTTRR